MERQPRRQQKLETVELLICLILIAISGFLSSSEIALFSLSKHQLKALRERFKTSYKLIKKLLGDPSGILVTVLIVNEVVNISLSTIVTRAISEHQSSDFVQFFKRGIFSEAPDWGFEILLGLLIATPIVLFLGEITPKVVAARANTLIAPLTVRPLHLLYRVMTPIRLIVQNILRFIIWAVNAKNSKAPNDHGNAKIREEDFISMVEEAHKEGDVQSSELELIKNVFDIDDTPVSEISKPLFKTFTLPQNTTLQQALIAMRDETQGQKFSRIPVTGKNKNDIIGVLYSKDLLVAKLERDPPQTPISSLLWKPFLVSESMRINSVFRKMKKQRIHMAITTNDKGVPVGIVTMNDVLEAMLDELLGDEEGEEHL